MKVRYSDNASTTLTVAANSGDTVFIVANATKFPAFNSASGDWAYITLEEEVVEVSAIDGNAFTCLPLQQNHEIGAPVELRVTTHMLDDITKPDTYVAPGGRPAAGSLQLGEVFGNPVDIQFGFGDTEGNPLDMLAVRFFSSAALYQIGDLVARSGQIWSSKIVQSGAWNEADWELGSGGGGGGMAWIMHSSGVVAAQVGIGYSLTTDTDVRAVELPIGADGATIGVNDLSGNCVVNNITITANGTERIHGSTDPFVFDINSGTIELTYINASRGWVVTGGMW